MPYTPPARSPVASEPETPPLSRSNSYTKYHVRENGLSSHCSQTGLSRSPSSRSYMNKHRRSPSITKTPSFTTEPPSPDATLLEKSSDRGHEQGTCHSPRKADQSLDESNQSTDASPAVSPPSSGDEEATQKRGRKREVTNLAELQAAIKIIEQHRAGSPEENAAEDTKKARIALGLLPPRLDVSKMARDAGSESSPRVPLSAGARKISHSRSTTDASAFFDFPRNKFDSPSLSNSQSDEDDIEDDEMRMKPALIRKKSGELVRPALRASSMRRRPSSMPGTPTYAKAVHFQENSLEHVRHFLQVDRPIAVSAGSSPVESFDDEDEFPFGSDNSSPPFEWEIRLTNFPRESINRQALPVRTERVYLSTDCKVLLGSVAVQNLAFHKSVVARFTLDFWKTTSEVMAEYDNDVRKQQVDDGCDRFKFSIMLEDQANLENKTMFFCVKYHVNGQDYWDNNHSINYQVDFSKNYKTHLGKKGIQAKRSPNGLPRNKAPRPRSMPSFEDFASMASPYEFSSFPQPSTIVGDSPIRFKNKPSSNDLLLDAPAKSKSPVNQAFGNRYDFGASLSAAIQAASSVMGSPREDSKPAPTKMEEKINPAAKQPSGIDAAKLVQGCERSLPNLTETPKPAALTSEKPSLSSSSYHELLDKYCFVRSGPTAETNRIVR